MVDHRSRLAAPAQSQVACRLHRLVKQKAIPRRRNPLVCQYIENLSSAALEAYADIIRDIVGRRHGVYALYQRDKLYYVGLATNLRNHLKSHLKDRHKGLWDRFSVYLTIDHKYLKELELLVIRIAQPCLATSSALMRSAAPGVDPHGPVGTELAVEHSHDAVLKVQVLGSELQGLPEPEPAPVQQGNRRPVASPSQVLPASLQQPKDLRVNQDLWGEPPPETLTPPRFRGSPRVRGSRPRFAGTPRFRGSFSRSCAMRLPLAPLFARCEPCGHPPAAASVPGESRSAQLPQQGTSSTGDDLASAVSRRASTSPL